MRLLLAAAAVLGLFSFPLANHAESITYTESVVASGSLGGRNFTNALVTITGSADTSQVEATVTGFAVLTPGARVTVAGVGTFNFTDPIRFFVSSAFDVAGVSDLTGFWGLDIVDTQNSAFEMYFLTTPFGPVAGLPVVNAGDPFSTSGGALILNSTGDSTFTATAD